ALLAWAGEANVRRVAGSAKRIQVNARDHKAKSATGVNLSTVFQGIFCEPSFIRIILLTSIPVFLLRNCFPPQIRLPVASAAAVRPDESATGAVVNRSAAKARAAIRKTMSRSTPKIRAMYSKPAVDKGGTPGDELVVIEDHESVVPIAAPVVPTPVMVEMPSDR